MKPILGRVTCISFHREEAGVRTRAQVTGRSQNKTSNALHFKVHFSFGALAAFPATFQSEGPSKPYFKVKSH